MEILVSLREGREGEGMGGRGARKEGAFSSPVFVREIPVQGAKAIKTQLFLSPNEASGQQKSKTKNK